MSNIPQKLKSLVGQKLVEIRGADDQFRVVTDTGSIMLRVEAGCCNSVWVEKIEVDPDAVGAIIRDVQMPRCDECIDGADEFVYELRIKTDRGDGAVEFRNQENNSGHYYGAFLRVLQDAA